MARKTELEQVPGTGPGVTSLHRLTGSSAERLCASSFAPCEVSVQTLVCFLSIAAACILRTTTGMILNYSNGGTGKMETALKSAPVAEPDNRLEER